MATTQPADIANGDIPDATVLMVWLKTWLNNGHGIKKDTYENLKAYALTVPDDPFIALTTIDSAKVAVMYVGDPSYGDDGFITFGGG